MPDEEGVVAPAPLAGEASEPAIMPAAAQTISPDGRWRWDGVQWVPVETPAAGVAVAPLKRKRSPARDSLILLIMGVIDTTIFPSLVPWVFFLFGLIQAYRARREGNKSTALLALNSAGLVVYLGACLVAAAVQGSPVWFVTYLLVSPTFFRVFTYLH